MNNPTTSAANPGPWTVIFEEEALFPSKEKFDKYTREISCYVAMGHQVTALPYVAVMVTSGVIEFYFHWKDIGKYVLFHFPTGSTINPRVIPAERKMWVEVKTMASIDKIILEAKKLAIVANPDLLSIYPALIKTYSTLTGVAAINVAPEKPKLPTKLTPDDITKVIAEVQYQVLPGTRVTTCLLVLQNGAKVVGVNYGSIDPAQHSEAMGRQEAYKDAVNKVWELEGYLLRQRLYEAGIDLEKNDGGH